MVVSLVNTGVWLIQIKVASRYGVFVFIHIRILSCNGRGFIFVNYNAMTKFNHDYKHPGKAIGLTADEVGNLERLIERHVREGLCISEVMEQILNEGLNMTEALFAGFLLGLVKSGKGAKAITIESAVDFDKLSTAELSQLITLLERLKATKT